MTGIMTGNRSRICALASAVLVALAGNAHAAQVDYAIDAGLEHDDNVRLVADDPISQRILRTGIGFVATEANATVQASVDGRVDYRHFQDHVYSDSVEGILSGRLNWAMVPDRLGFTVQDDLELQAIDRFAPDSPDNRQQVNVLSLGPDLYFTFSPRLRGVLEARYIDTDAEVTDEFNSSRLGLALRAIRDLGPDRTLSFNGQVQDIDFDNDAIARDHHRSDLFARYEHQLPHVQMTVDLGYSQVGYRQGGSRSNPLLRAELGWRPGDRNRFVLAAVDQFADAADAAIGETGLETAVPGNVLISGVTVTSSVYRERRVELGYTHDGARSTFFVDPYVQRINYLDAGPEDESSHGVRAGFDYRLRPLLTLSGYLDYERIDYRGIDRNDDLRRAGLTLERRWTRHWSAALDYYRYARESPVHAANVEQNVWYLSVTYRNR